MRPLQVYLDSSDLSELSNPVRTEAHDDIERQLVAWSEAGLIELRFSYLHVIEASPVKPDDINSSAARLQKILHLCSRKCFTSTISILEREISHPGEWNSAAYFDWLYREDGGWLPDIDDLIGNDFSPYEKLRDELCRTAPDRKTRRKLERRWFDQQGKLKPAAKARLGATQAASAKEFEERFPLPPGSAQHLAESLAEGNAANIQSLLRKALSDLSCWPAWYAHHWDRVDPVSSFLRRGARNLNEQFATAALEVQQAYDQGLRSGLAKDHLDHAIRTSFKKSALPMYENMVMRLSDIQGIEPTATSQTKAWNLRPGLATIVAVHQQVARRNMGLSGRPRAPSDSDVGDILHCTHIPFVDVFRADGFMASVISEARLPFPTTVVSKLPQLPIAIEAGLKKRRALS